MSQMGKFPLAGAGVPVASITGNSGGGVPPNGLGNINIIGAGGITVTGNPFTHTLTITDSSGPQSYTNVNTTPYVVLPTDSYLSVDTSALSIIIQLPNAPAALTEYVVKDRTGSAGVRHITVTTFGGVVLIDGAASYNINTNYESVSLLFNGTTYEVY